MGVDKFISIKKGIRHKFLKLIWLCVLFCCTATIESALAQAEQSEIEQGAEIAFIHCRRCHVIDEQNLYDGISSTPSFPLLVNYMEDWEESFS